MLHSKLIKKEDVNTIFMALANKYESLGGNNKVSIHLVGGAAIVSRFKYRASTTDIDAYYLDNDILNKAIEQTSKELSLPLDWLNKEFTNTPSYTPNIIGKAVLLSKYGKYIRVYTLEPKYLIAMKLKSSRPTGGDLDDVIKMIYELRYNRVEISYDEIIAAYNELYDDFSNTYDYFLRKTKEAFETPIEDIEPFFISSI